MRDLSIGNGKLTLVFDAKGRVREVFHPVPGLWNHTLGAPCEIGLITKGTTNWLGDGGQHATTMKSSRHLEAQWELSGPQITLSMSTVIDDTLPLVRRDFHLQAIPGQHLTLLLHHDFRLLETEYQDGVRFLKGESEIRHSKRQQSIGIGLLGSSLTPRWTLGRRDSENGRGIRALVERQGLDNNLCAVGAGESILGIDLVCDESGSATVSTYLAAWQHKDVETALRKKICGPWSKKQWEKEETASRPDWTIPAVTSLSIDVLSVFEDAVIASPDTESLSQAREHYAYVWPRDGAFVAMTWDRLGNRLAAKKFYDFCVSGLSSEGFLGQRYSPDGSPGSSWHPEFESGIPYRPIQEDSTALCCLAAARHVEAGLLRGESSQLADDLVFPCGRFLLNYRDAETGLPLPSHDLWEERFGIHTFTVASVIAALKACGTLGHKLRRSDSGEYLQAAKAMEESMRTRLFHQDAGRYARMATVAENGDLHLDTTPDASLCGLFLFDHDLIHDDLIKKTIESIEPLLTIDQGVGGIARYSDDHYHRRSRKPEEIPGNPWLICTLWFAHWHLLVGSESSKEQASQLMDWVIRHMRPSGAMPEQVHPLNGESVSVCPLLWSHSTWIDVAMAARNPDSQIP